MKARLILLLITVFCIVGGVIAAKLRGEHVFYSKGPNGQCTVPVILIYTTTFSGGITTKLSTAPTTDCCPVIRVTETD